MARKLSKPEIKAYLLREIATVIEHYGEAGELHGALEEEEWAEIARLQRVFSAKLGTVDENAETRAWDKLDSRLHNARY